MNSGTAEQEQNGVTIPKPAAATVPTTAFRPASAPRTLSGDDERAQERDEGHDPGEEQQDLGHVVEEEGDGLAELRTPGRARGRRRPATSRAAGRGTRRPATAAVPASDREPERDAGRGGPRAWSPEHVRQRGAGAPRPPPRRARSRGTGRSPRGGRRGQGPRRAASRGGCSRCCRARPGRRPSRTRSAGRRPASAGCPPECGRRAATPRRWRPSTSGAGRSRRGSPTTGSGVAIGFLLWPGWTPQRTMNITRSAELLESRWSRPVSRAAPAVVGCRDAERVAAIWGTMLTMRVARPVRPPRKHERTAGSPTTDSGPCEPRARSTTRSSCRTSTGCSPSPRWSATSSARRSTPCSRRSTPSSSASSCPTWRRSSGRSTSRIEAELAGHHSLAPMREEHRTIDRLVEELGRYRAHVDGCTWSAVEGMALRRALYRLHALLKVHLAEEELYLGVLERRLTDAEKDKLARSLDHAMAEGLVAPYGSGWSNTQDEVGGVELRDQAGTLLHDGRPLVERRRARLRDLVVAPRRAGARSPRWSGPGRPARGRAASGRPGRRRRSRR